MTGRDNPDRENKSKRDSALREKDDGSEREDRKSGKGKRKN